MPFPAAREGRWLARVLLSQNVCLVFLFPSQPPSTHPSRGAIWSHCLLNPGHAKIHFCFFGKHYSSQAEMPGVWIFGLSMILVPWTLPITQIFLPGLGSVFSAFPWFLKLCAHVLHLLQPLCSGFVHGCSADTWILASNSHLLTCVVPRSFPSWGLQACHRCPGKHRLPFKTQ